MGRVQRQTPRRTKIVATLGPATATAEAVVALARAGMDAARFNFSHGTHDEHAERAGSFAPRRRPSAARSR